jgi:nucleotide-binding universal stress UspA family protein
MKILCPIDFSDHADIALQEAIYLCNGMNGELTLITTYEVPITTGSLISLEDVISKNRKEELTSIENRVKKLLNPDLKLKSKLIKGNPKTVISNYAKSNSMDLIVMGTQGSTNMENIILGSVTKAVIRYAEVPVLAIPLNGENSLRNGYFLLALDSDEIENKETVDILLDLCDVYDTKLDIFHVSKVEDICPIDPYIDELLSSCLNDIIVEKAKNPIKAIKKYVVDHHVNMLIMIRRKKSVFERLFLKGHTEEELFRTKIPLLVLPEIS